MNPSLRRNLPLYMNPRCSSSSSKSAPFSLLSSFTHCHSFPVYEPQILEIAVPRYPVTGIHQNGESLRDLLITEVSAEMSTNKSIRKEHDKNKKSGRLTEKAMSFHGQAAEEMVGKLRRPRTLPDLISGTGRVASSTEIVRPKLTKLLLNVTVQRSLGPVQVLISLESTVGDLVSAALRQYSKEGRRPILPSINSSGFGLHYSQFSLESLDPDEKLSELGSRNFFLCPKRSVAGDDEGEVGSDNAVMTTSSTCSTEATKSGGGGWLRFVNLSL